MALVTTPTYIAFFSTDGRRFSPRSVDPLNLPVPIIRSDEKVDMDKMIKRLRARWPHQCNGIFARSSQDHQQWHLHWFFDEYDFYVLGGKFLYDLLCKMQRQNECAVRDFVTSWSKTNEHTWSSINFDHMTVQDTFSNLDKSRLGEEFLETCLRHIKSKYYGAHAQHNENLIRGYQKFMAQMNNAQPGMVNNDLASTTMSARGIDQFGYPSEHLLMHPMRAQGTSMVPGLPYAPQLSMNDGFNYESAMAKPFLPNHQMVEGYQNSRSRELSQDDRKLYRPRGGKNQNAGRRQSLSNGSDVQPLNRELPRDKPRGNSFIRQFASDHREVSGADRPRQTSLLGSEEHAGASEVPQNSMTISAFFVGRDIDYLTNVYLGTVPRGTLRMEDIYNTLKNIVDVEWVSVSFAPEKDQSVQSAGLDLIFADVKTTDAVRHLLAIKSIRCLDLNLLVKTPRRMWRNGLEGPRYVIPPRIRPDIVCPVGGKEYTDPRRAAKWRSSSTGSDHKPLYSPQDARSTLHKLPDGGTVPPDKVDDDLQRSQIPVLGLSGHAEAKSSSRSPPKKSNRRSSKMESIVEEKLTSASNHDYLKPSQTLAGADPTHKHVLESSAVVDDADALTSQGDIKTNIHGFSHKGSSPKTISKPSGKEEHKPAQVGLEEIQKAGASLRVQEILGKDNKEDEMPRADDTSGVKARMSNESFAPKEVPQVDITEEEAANTRTSRDTQDPILDVNFFEAESNHFSRTSEGVNQGGAPQCSLTTSNLLGLALGSSHLPEFPILSSGSATSTVGSREPEPTTTTKPMLGLLTSSAMVLVTASGKSVVSNGSMSPAVLLAKVQSSPYAVLTTDAAEENARGTTEPEAGGVETSFNQNHLEESASSTSSFLAPASTIERPKSGQAQHELASWTKDLDKTLKAAGKLPMEKQGDLISKAETIRSELLTIEQRYGDAIEKAFSSSSKKTTRKTQMKKVKQLQEAHGDKILELFALHGDCQRENARIIEDEDRQKKKKNAVVPEVVAEPPKYPQHHPDAAVFNTRHRNAPTAQQWLVIILLDQADSRPVIILSETHADSSASRPAVTNNYHPDSTMILHDLSHYPERPFVSQINSIDDIDSFQEMMRKDPRTGLFKEVPETSSSSSGLSSSEEDDKAPPPKSTNPGASQLKLSYASVAKRQTSKIVPALPKVPVNTKPDATKKTEKNVPNASEWQVAEDWSRTGGYQKKG